MDYSFKFTQKVFKYIEENEMIHEGDDIIVGLSGGGDSVCLFLVLNELKKKINFNLFAVHINHGIRGISAIRDEMFALSLCEREKIPCKVVHIDAVKRAKDEKITLEEAGRKARYEVFNEEAREHNNAKIAVAHHINDQAETVLFNLIRGSGLKGMGGIKPSRDNILRPLLCVTRDEIVYYLKERDEDFCTDETNEDDEYTRNYIRNKVMPILAEIQPETASHLAKTAEEMREANEYIELKAREVFERSVICASKEEIKREGIDESKLEKDREGYVILLKEIKNEMPIIIRNVIILTMQMLTDEWKDVSRIHIQDVYSLIEKGSGKEIHLPKGLLARRVKEGIYIVNIEKDKSM